MEARSANPNGVGSRVQRVDIVLTERTETHGVGKRLGRLRLWLEVRYLIKTVAKLNKYTVNGVAPTMNSTSYHYFKFVNNVTCYRLC